jgi:nitroreductase
MFTPSVDGHCGLLNTLYERRSTMPNNSLPSDYSDRDPLDGVNPLLVERWSPRAFAPGAIDDTVLGRIVDAARWAPSCFNEQPWRFYTSTQSTFDDYLGLLMEGNRGWAASASVIGFLVAKTRFAHNGKDNDYHAFDSGAAWMAMSLQARSEGLFTHGMAGIDKQGVADYLKLDPQNEAVLMGFVIGRLGDSLELDPAMQSREKPSPRKPLQEIWNP